LNFEHRTWRTNVAARTSLNIKSYAARLNETGEAASHTVAVNQLNKKRELSMKKSKRSFGKVRFVLCGVLGVLAAALMGCTTYVEHRHPRTVYAPPPEPPPVIVTPAPPVVVTPAPPPVVVAPAEAPVVVIRAESDFYEPLNPYGTWVVVGSYGRCWRPSRVDVGWRPYCEGHWQRTDAGWYWASDEPWGWATYHYGRWDWSVGFGWIWVPHTQWAPAWVSWRQGAGYVGWAPLPPSARIVAGGVLEVRETAFAPHAFVFVSEQRLLEPVRHTTVIVNNTTIVKQTVNITKVHVVNKRVIAEGPRPEIIERKSGRKIEAVPVHELRRREETAVVVRSRNVPSSAEKKVQPTARTESAPPGTIAPRGTGQVEQPAAAPSQSQPPARRNEVRGVGARESSPKPERPGVETPARHERRPEINGEKTRIDTAPAAPAPRTHPEAMPAVRPRETGQPPAATRQSQTPAKKNEVRGTGETKSSVGPERPGAERTLGHERQHELEPVKGKPETRQPAQTPSGKQIEKGKTLEKPAANERGAKKKKEKKAEEQEKPKRPD